MAHKKITIQKKKIRKEISTIVYPLNKNKLYYFFIAFSFLAPFFIYLLTLAPTVTLEDSGELITAAYFLGVPHEPGYPLFVIFGKLFSLLPLGTIAFRVNMMSAFFNSLAALFLFQSIVLIIEDTFIKTEFWNKIQKKQQQYLKYTVAISGALFWAFAFKTWEQSIIAEVYGINDFFIALFILVFLKWKRQSDELKKKKYFYFLCAIIGMALTTHTTAGMIIPVLGGYILLKERSLLTNLKFLGKSFIFFLAGLTPWLFLPFASLKNPPVDWGNPDNFTNLIRVITRHQYQASDTTINVSGAETFGFFFKELLPMQWYFVFLLLIPIGLYILFKNNRSFFYFILFFLIMAIPVLSYLTRDFLTNEENKTLASVFYIPAYMILSLLLSVGLYYIISFLKPVKPIIISVCLVVVLLPFTSLNKNYKDLDMHQYYFAEEYANNIFATLPKNSMYFINWDPFGFPMTYFQFVEKKREDIIVVDQMLLKRSWYIQWLREYYPDIMNQSKTETDEFLAAVAPFEAGDPYNGTLIQQKYIAMINSLIDKKQKAGLNVYFAYLPEKEILRHNHLEPQFAAYKYTNAAILDSAVDDKKIKLKSFLDSKITKDRMAKYMADFYGDLYGARATYLEQSGKTDKALEYYTKASILFDHTSKKANFTTQRIYQLKKLKQ